MEKDERNSAIQHIKTSNLLLDNCVNSGIDEDDDQIAVEIPRLDLSSFNQDDICSSGGDDEKPPHCDVTKPRRTHPMTSLSSSPTRIPSMFTCDSLCSYPWRSSRRVFNTSQSTTSQSVTSSSRSRSITMAKVHDRDRIPSVFHHRDEKSISGSKPVCLKPVAAHRRSKLRDHRMLLHEEDPNVIQWFPRPKEEIRDLIGSSSNKEIQQRKGGVSWRVRHENARKHPTTEPMIKSTNGKSPQTRESSIAKFHPYNKSRPVRITHGSLQESTTATVHVDNKKDAMGGGESCDVTKKAVSDSDSDDDDPHYSDDSFETDSLTFASSRASSVTSSPRTSSSSSASTSSVGVCEEDFALKRAAESSTPDCVSHRSSDHRSPPRKVDDFLVPASGTADRRAYDCRDCNVQTCSYAPPSGSPMASARTSQPGEISLSNGELSSGYGVGESLVLKQPRRRKTRVEVFEELREFSRTFQRMKGDRFEIRQQLQDQLSTYSTPPLTTNLQQVSKLKIYRSAMSIKLYDVIYKIQWNDVIVLPTRKLMTIVLDLFGVDDLTDEIKRISKMVRQAIREKEEEEEEDTSVRSSSEEYSSEKSSALTRFLYGCDNWELKKEIFSSCFQLFIFASLYICIYAFIISFYFTSH